MVSASTYVEKLSRKTKDDNLNEETGNMIFFHAVLTVSFYPQFNY